MKLDADKIFAEAYQRIQADAYAAPESAIRRGIEHYVRALCSEFNRAFEKAWNDQAMTMLERADTQLLERAAVMLAERVRDRGTK